MTAPKVAKTMFGDELKPKPSKPEWVLARRAVGRALFGGDDAVAIPEDDETTFAQTQGRLVIEVARVLRERRG